MRRLFPVLLLALAAACDKNPTSADFPERNLRLGDQITLNVNADSVCSNPTNRQARVVALSEHTAVLADVSNPAGGFTEADFQSFADEFERVIYPTDTENFGTPSDVDHNGKVMILFTGAVNELTERNGTSIVGGFFFSRDLYPTKNTKKLGACASSNQGELFYLLAPDPNGTINGNRRSKEYVRTSSFATLAHEFQHLINASRRLHVYNITDLEETWLDEGLSHAAEELVFYRASGLLPRQNLALTSSVFDTPTKANAFNQYQSQNFGRLQRYYENPDDNSPIQNDDDLETRGSAWQFLRYAADQRGGDEQKFWYALVNSKLQGLNNLKNALGSDPTNVFQSWGVSVYTDDAVPGVPAVFQQPSWNYRQVFTSNGGRFPLRTTVLANATPSNFSIPAQGQAYIRFGVAAGVRADVRVVAQNTAATGSCTNVTLNTVGQSVQMAGAAASALCVGSDAPGAEFVYIPFYGATANDARAPITVTATGVVPVIGPPNPTLVATGGPTLRAATELGGRNDRWEMALRARERAVLGRLGGSFAARNTLADPPAPELRVTIVRTR